MDQPRLNPRQIAMMHDLRTQLQVAEANYTAARERMNTFINLVKAQFDLPEGMDQVQVGPDGSIMFMSVTDQPTVPADLVKDATPPLSLVAGAGASEDSNG